MRFWHVIFLGLIRASASWASESLGPGETKLWDVAGYKEIWVYPEGTRLELTGWGGVKLLWNDGGIRPLRICGSGDEPLRIRSLEKEATRSYSVERKAESLSPEGCALQLQARGTSDLTSRVELLRKAGEAYRSAADWQGLAETLTPLGEALWELGKTQDALAAHEQAVEGWSRVSGGEGRRGEAMVTLAVGYSLLPQTRSKYAATIRRALELARAGNDAAAEGLALSNVVTDVSFGGAGLAAEGDGRAMGRKAVELLRKAAYRSGEATAWNSLGQWLENRSLDEAASAYKESMRLRRDLENEVGVAQSLNNLAGVLNKQGEPQEAVLMLEQALSIRKRVATPRAVANTQHNLGVQYVEAGDLDKALGLFEEAMAVWLKVGERFGEAATQTEMATAYERRGALDRAERAYEKALIVQRSLGRKRVESNVLRGWARVLQQKGQEKLAAEKASEAARIAREGNFPVELARALQSQASLLARAKDFEGALNLLEEARGIAKAASAPDHGHMLTATAHALREAGRIDEALAAYAEAEKVARDLESVGDRQSIHAGRAMALLAKGDVSAAKAESRLGMELLEDWRANLSSAASRAELVDRRHLVYEAAVAALMRAGETAAAFEASERGRARSFAEMLESGVSPMGMSAVGIEERTLRARVAAKSSQLLRLRTRGAAEPELRRAKGEWLALEDQYAALQERWSREHPALERARQAATLAEVQAALRPGEVLVEYATGSNGSVAWIVSRDRIESVGMAPPPRRLSNYRRLYIVTDSALETKALASVLPLTWQGGIAALPSGKALTLLNEPPKIAGRKVVVFADPLYEAGETTAQGLRFPRLRFSGAEATAVSRLWGEKAILKLRAEASREALLRTRWESVGLAHFAAHSDFDSLVLSLFDSDSRPVNGQLRIDEIGLLRFDKALVVLSACGTADGKRLAGEGPLSLARAFLGAGASGVVATLWEVDDAASARLMELFHEGLRLKGLAPAEALRRAQMSVSREPRWADPHFWAGYVYFGR